MMSIAMIRERLNNDPKPYVIAWLVMVSATVVYAIKADYFYFADSSYFLCSILAHNVQEGVWQQFPQRIAAFLLTQWPALISAHFELDAGFAKYSYAAAFLAFPVLTFLVSVWINRDRDALVCSGMTVCILCFSTLGFPTETCISVALVMLLTVTITAKETTAFQEVVKKVILCVVPPLAVFTHESTFLSIPSIAALLWVSSRQKLISGRLVMLLAGSAAAALSVWLFVHFEVRPTNPMIEEALQKNSRRILQVDLALERPLLQLVCLGFLLPILIKYCPSKYRSFLLGVLSVMAVSAFREAWKHDLVGDRYTVRTILTWLMPLIPLSYKLLHGSDKRQWIIATLAVFAITSIHVRSIYYWESYKEHVVAAANGSPVHMGGLSKRHVARISSYRWDWALPYLTATLTSKNSRKLLLVDEQAWYSPLTCASLKNDSKFHVVFTPEEISMLDAGVKKRLNCP